MTLKNNSRRAVTTVGVLATVALGVGTVVGVATQAGAAKKAAVPVKAVTATVKPFSLALKGVDGNTASLAKYAGKATVVVFVGTECPIANGYSESLTRLAKEYAGRGASFVAVNANDSESLEAVTKHAKSYALGFPILKDEGHRLADALDAKVTPEVFVLDASQKVRYRGRIDDQYASRTEKRRQARNHDLELALNAVLAGKPVAQAQTQAFGCAIVRTAGTQTAASGPSYHKDVLPILQERCQSCHRPGQVAPFSLLNYADAKNWATEIKTFTQNRQMPPWQAEPGHGEFQDVRRLTDTEVATLAKWADAGAPEGSSVGAPPAKQWSSDWALGKPDLVLTMPESFSVAAAGEDVFRCFVLPTSLTEDKQVVGVEVRPGNSKVVHHVLNFIDTGGRGRKLDVADAEPGYNSGPGGVGFFPSGQLGGWAPGNFPRFLPNGVGMALPKGSDVVVQMHYHKTGKPEVDQTSIALYFAKEPVQKQLRVLPLTSLNIRIPANEPRHEVKASMRLPWDITALSITPHMHLLGKEMKVTATLPDGTVKSMVLVKNWDYRWQDNFEYKEPVKLPKGTQLNLVAYFDNSLQNLRNPSNPPRLVTFGEQTTDEMCFAFIRYTRDQEPAGSGPTGFFGARPGGPAVAGNPIANRPILRRLLARVAQR